MKKVKRSFKLKSRLAFTTSNVEAKTLSLSLSLSLSLPRHIRVMLEFWKLVLNHRRTCHFRKGRNSNCFKSIKRVHCWHFLNSVSSYRFNEGCSIWNIALVLLQISRQLETFTDMTSSPFFFSLYQPFHPLVCGCSRILRHPQSREWKGHWTDDGNWRELNLRYLPIFPLFWDWDKLVIRKLTRYSFNVFELLSENQKGEGFPYSDYIIFLHQILSNAKITLKTYMLENSWKYIYH